MKSRRCRSQLALLARLALSMLLLFIVSGSAARAAPPDKSGEHPGLSSLSAMIENDYVKAVEDDDGTFVIGTTGGDPTTPADDNKRLLYGYPNSPWSSFTTVRVVTAGQVSDVNLNETTTQQPPARTNGQIVTIWSVQNVEVWHALTLQHNPYTGRADTVRIEYTLLNRDSVSHDVGVRIMLDVMIGDNDGAPYLIAGIDNQTTEVEYLGSDVPAFWQAFESDTFDPQSLKGMGILRGAEATPPDRFVIARWWGISDTLWDYPVTPGETVTGDSATALYWNPVTLAPGASRTLVTYYGLAGAGGGDAWFLAPAAVTCNNPSFDAVLRVSNTSTSRFRGGSATLSFPQGLVLAAGETATKSLGDVPPGETASLSWRITADWTVMGALTYSARITFASGSDPLTAEASIQVPAVCLEIFSPTTQNPAGAGSFDLPEKFWVEVSKAEDRLTRADFAVEVAGQPALITGIVEAADRYKLEIYPPTLPATLQAGAHLSGGQRLVSLTVRVVSIAGVPTVTIDAAVVIGTRDTDVILCMDSSGSMDLFYGAKGLRVKKFRMAKDAATALTMTMPVGWKLGAVRFSGKARIPARLRMTQIPADPGGNPWNNPTRLRIVDSIDRLLIGGGTSIGAGLRAADNEMRARADWWSDWAIVLLTDGRENVRPWARDVLPDLVEDIYPIAFGSRDYVHWTLLWEIARRSGTRVHYVDLGGDGLGSRSLTNGDFPDLTGAYVSALTAMQGHQLLFHETGLAQRDVSYDYQLRVDPCHEAVFFLTWLNQEEALSLTLQDPNGTVITETTSDPNVLFAKTDTLNYCKVLTPVGGLWSLRVTGSPQITSGGQPYGLHAYGGKVPAVAPTTMEMQSLSTTVPPTTMVVQPPTTAVLKGQPLRLATTLNDSGPVGAVVNAIVQPPTSASSMTRSSDTVRLYDDGAHGDGGANDGLYANSYMATATAGPYNVRIEASGTNNSGQPFRRVAEDTFYVSEPLAIGPIPPSCVTVQPGSLVTHTVHYNNATSDTLTGVTVDVTYDSQLTFVNASPAPSSGNNHWDLGDLTPGASGIIDIVCRVGSGATVGADVAIQVSINSNQTDPVTESAPTTVAGPPDSMAVSAYPEEVWVRSSAAVMVSIRDADGRLVGDGVPVTLTTDHGAFPQGPAHETTTTGGGVEVPLSSNFVGTATVQVTAGSVSEQLSVEFVAPPNEAFLPLLIKQ